MVPPRHVSITAAMAFPHDPVCNLWCQSLSAVAGHRFEPHAERERRSFKGRLSGGMRSEICLGSTGWAMIKAPYKGCYAGIMVAM